MKYIAPLSDKSNIVQLAKVLDGIILSNELFSTRFSSSFDIKEINEILDRYHKKLEIFLNLNQMLTDYQLDLLKNFLEQLDLQKIYGIIFADLGVIKVLKDLGIEKKGVYNPETLLTNYFDFNFHKTDHLFGAYLSKEITLTDIITIGQKKQYNVFFYGHGYLNMFYSKRKLVKNYFDFIASPVPKPKEMKLLEQRRENIFYPLLEDNGGTHVFRSNVMSSFEELSEISAVVDYFVIDSIFHDDNYTFSVAKMYRDGDLIDFHEIQTKYRETWDDGFLSKKTIYKITG